MRIHTTHAAVMALVLAFACVTIGAQVAVAQEQLLSEDFDAYQAGEFPDGWTLVTSGAGPEYQVVTDAEYHSSPDSFTLKGMQGTTAIVEYEFSHLPEIVSFASYHRSSGTEGDEHTSAIGLWNRSDGTYCVVHFSENITLRPTAAGGDTVLVPNVRNQWYAVMVEYNATLRTASVWIDNQLVAWEVPMRADGSGYDAIHLGNGNAGVPGYFDDISVWVGRARAVPVLSLPGLTVLISLLIGCAIYVFVKRKGAVNA